MNILGRVARGVGGVAKGVGGVVYGEARAVFNAAAPDDESEVETLLQRISDALTPEFRREAMGQLKDVLTDNPKAQLAFGSMGIPVLLGVLTEDRDDLELLRGALEALVQAMSGRQAAAAPAPGPDLPAEAQAAAINAELFARKPENVALLLTLLEDEPVGVNDFYVRYYTVQLLTALLQLCAYKLQEAILASPMGVVRLMDMLMEREVIRNEALLLLVALTRSNEEVQKIAAFEGAFDRVFNIIREEGAVDGGVIVQDCLELLNNLLRGNVANQRLFREMGYIGHLPTLLESATARAGGDVGSSLADNFLAAAAAAGSSALAPTLSRQKATILLCTFETVMLLAAPPSAASEDARTQEQQARTANQAKMLGVGVMEALVPLCLGDAAVPSVVVRAQALRCLGELSASNLTGQEKLAAITVRVQGQILPALQASLRAVLYAADPRERVAAEHVIMCFCKANPDGQSTLASTIAPVASSSTAPGNHHNHHNHQQQQQQQQQQWFGAGNAANGYPEGARPDSVGPPPPPAETFGAELVSAMVQGLQRQGQQGRLQVGCRAARVLQHLLDGNVQCKQRVLSIPLELPSSAAAPPELLMPRCIRYLSESLQLGEQGRLAVTVLLRLLIVWLHECAPAVAALLQGAANLPLLVDLINGRARAGDANVSGLAAVLAGVCVLYGRSSSSSSGRAGPGAGPPGPASASSPAAMVLDVITTRVGFSQFFERLDELQRAPLFVAACSQLRLPKPLTRTAAAAATADDVGITDEDGPEAYSTPSKAATQQASESPYDFAFTQFIKQLDAMIKQHMLEAFASPSDGPGSQVALDIASQLPGTTDGERLFHAINAIRQLEMEVHELRSRNKALAEDVMKGASGHSASSAAALAGGQQAGAASSGTNAAMEIEARVAAELRASRAEMEVGTLQHQLEVVQQRLAQAEYDAAAARASGDTAHATASRYEGELQDLSTAYNALETHCYQLESQLRAQQAQVEDLQAKLAATTAAAGAGDAASPAATAGGALEEEVQRRIEEAAATAREEARKEGEEQMTDLLVCLGQEEQKVAVLTERLQALGVDVDKLFESITDEQQDGS